MSNTPLTPRRLLIVGNWKMSGSHALVAVFTEASRRRTRTSGDCEIVLCPPTPFLDAASRDLSGQWGLAAQDCHWAQDGAYTGEVSAMMLGALGCGYVLVGHSERRLLMGETNDYVRAKVSAVLEAGLVPILCVGETLEQYEAQQTFVTLAAQLYDGLPPEAVGREVVIAYEPVWAIGSGRTPSTAEVQECHDHTRTFLCTHWDATQGEATRILYGGSVKPANALEFLSLADVDGVLVGGASLVIEDFLAIVDSAS